MSVGNQRESNYKTTPGIFEVQSILQRGRSENEIFYLVKWKGYSEQQATWQPESNLSGCREAIAEFQRIIKRMQQEKTAVGSLASSKMKRKSKRDRGNQHVNSKLKEISNNEESKNIEQFKKNETQLLVVDNRMEEKSERKRSPQSVEVQRDKATQSLETLSSNDDIQSTTAQTIQSKISSTSLKLLHQLPKGNSTDDIKKVTNQLNTHPKPSMKIENVDALQRAGRSKKQVLDRQRENSQILKANERITKKSKKSEDNETLDHQRQQNSQLQKVQIKQNNHPTKLKAIEKEQIPQINRNKQLIGQQVTESQLKMRKSQSLISQRQALCDEQFRQLTIEFFGSLDSRLRRELKINYDQYSISQYCVKSTKRFIDLTNPLFSFINSKVVKIILTQKQAEKLDNQGDLLYCQIEVLIKICEFEAKDKRCSWITAMRCYETGVKKNQDCYFIKIDDLKSDTWKKKFRKFLVPNNNI